MRPMSPGDDRKWDSVPTAEDILLSQSLLSRRPLSGNAGMLEQDCIIKEEANKRVVPEIFRKSQFLFQSLELLIVKSVSDS